MLALRLSAVAERAGVGEVGKKGRPFSLHRIAGRCTPVGKESTLERVAVTAADLKRQVAADPADAFELHLLVRLDAEFRAKRADALAIRARGPRTAMRIAGLSSPTLMPCSTDGRHA